MKLILSAVCRRCAAPLNPLLCLPSRLISPQIAGHYRPIPGWDERMLAGCHGYAIVKIGFIGDALTRLAAGTGLYVL